VEQKISRPRQIYTGPGLRQLAKTTTRAAARAE